MSEKNLHSEFAEEFVSVKGFPDYEMTISGTVRNKKTKHICKPYEFMGLQFVSVRKNSKSVKRSIAKLLLRTYKDSPACENFKFVDGDKSNLSLDNLCWVAPVKSVTDKNERWCKIKETDGLYSISNTGKIKKNSTNHILHNFKLNNKIYVQIQIEGKKKQLLVARLLAEYFLVNPNKYNFVIYRDGNTQNINLDNLIWSKQAYIKESKKKNMPKNSIPVKQFSLSGKYITTYKSVSEASYKTSTPYRGIFYCCKKRQHTAGGYIWRFGNDNSRVLPRIKEIEKLDGEEFKEIPGFDKYKISNFGRVTSIYSTEKLLKPYKTKYGITSYCLKKDKKACNKSAAYLMAITFLSNPRKYKYVRYIDGNPDNIKLENIKWSKKRVKVNQTE